MQEPSFSNTPPLRAAVVGTGGISHEHLGFLASSPRVDLVGVCDTSDVSANYMAERFGTTPYGSLDDLLETGTVEVLHVLTPPQTHVPLSTAALRAGAHVICEKPIALSENELQTLFDEADEANKTITENHNYRFNPEIAVIDALIADGQLGDVRDIDVRIALPITDPDGRFGDPNLVSPVHSLPGGAVHDFITHMTYLMLHFAANADFSTIAAHWNNHAGVDFFTADDLDAIIIGTHKKQPLHARLRFSAQTAPDSFELTVRGTKGSVEVELFTGRIIKYVDRLGGGQLSPIASLVAQGAELASIAPKTLSRKIMQNGPYVGLRRFLDETYAALQTGTDVPVTRDNVLHTTQLIDALVAQRMVKS